MSGEFFETIFVVDMRTSPDDPRKVEYGKAGTMTPRMFNESGGIDTVRAHTWVCVTPYVDDVLSICADTLRDTPMDGISGDFHKERHRIADRLDVLAEAVRYLAYDAAHDGRFNEHMFADIMARETA